MDLPGRFASVILLSAGLLFVLSGCSGNSSSQYESYDQLQKSPAGQSPAGQPPVVQASPDAKVDQSQPKTNDGKTTVREPTTQAPKLTFAKAATPSIATQTPTQARKSDLAVDYPTGSAAMKSPSVSPPAAIASNPSLDTKPGGARSVSTASEAGAPRKAQVLIATKTFQPEGAEAAWRVSYNDIDLLKVLNMDPVTPDAPAIMPAWLKGLDGRRIRIRGFMYPTFQQTGIRAFALARDNQICCFGRNPKIYDVFDVLLRDGVTTNYLPNRPFDVVGVFHIRPEVEDGKLYRIYEMDDAVIVTR